MGKDNKITYGSLVREIAEETGLYHYQVRSVLKALGACVCAHLKLGKKVYLQPVGRFHVTYMVSHRQSHPKTGRTYWIPERMIPKFNWGKRVYRTIRNRL